MSAAWWEHAYPGGPMVVPAAMFPRPLYPPDAAAKGKQPSVDGPDCERPYDSYYDVDYPGIVAAAGGFGPVTLWTHDWEQPCDEDLLVARAESVSVVGSLPPADKQRVLARVRHLADTHPDLAGRDRFPFPYTTRVYRCARR